MGGEGSMMHAIKSLQNNRSLLKRRKSRSKDDVYGKKSVTMLNLKTSTRKDINRIRRLMEVEKHKNTRVTWLAMGATILFFVLCYLLVMQ